MEFKAALKGDLHKILEKKNKALLRSANKAVTLAANDLKKEMVGQTQRAKLGYGLAKSWRVNFYNHNKKDKFKKALVYTKSPHIMEGFENGGIRKPTKGKWLAIPTDNVPKSRRKRYSPSNWPKSFPELYFAQDTKGNSYLVGQTIHKTMKSGKKTIRKINSRNESEAASSRRRQDEVQTVIYFFLKKQTRHTKKLKFEKAGKNSQKKLKLYLKQEIAKTEK